MISETVVPWKYGNTWCRIVGDITANTTPLIVVHGGPGMSWDYLGAHDRLGDAGRPVIYYDQLGGARSKPVTAPKWQMDLFVEELTAVVTHFNLMSFDLLGHSWGASLVLDFATGPAYGLRRLVAASASPSTEMLMREWRRLLSEAPGVDLGRVEQLERAGRTRDDEYVDASEAFEKRHFCTISPAPPSLERSAANLATDVYADLWGPEHFRCTGRLADWDVTDRLPSIARPVLVINGRDDQATPECGKAIVDRLPNGSLVVVSGASHMAHLESPDRYFAAVQDFLA